MAKTKQKKEQELTSYLEKIKKAKGMVFANFDGLKVKEIEALRKLCRQQGIDYVVSKKTLMKRAFSQTDISGVETEKFTKGVTTVLGYDDEVAPAKLVGEFAKAHEALQPIGGVMEKKFIDREMVITLSKLPSKLELLAQVVGSIKAPVSGFVNVLSGTLRSLVGVLDAIAKK